MRISPAAYIRCLVPAHLGTQSSHEPDRITKLHRGAGVARVLLIALVLHAVGMLMSLKEPRIFDLWISRAHPCKGEKPLAVAMQFLPP